MSDIVNKLWGFCHTLRHDGIDYGDYIEQLTYLLFLKMADERGVESPEGLRLGQPQGQVRHRADRPLRRHPPQAPRSRRAARRHLRPVHAALQQSRQPQARHRHDRRGGVVGDGRGREGRGLRGPARKGRQRRQERRGPILHAPRAHPVHRPRDEARPARQAGLHASATRPAAPAAFSFAPTNGSWPRAKGVFDRADAQRIKTQDLLSARTSCRARAGSR